MKGRVKECLELQKRERKERGREGRNGKRDRGRGRK